MQISLSALLFLLWIQWLIFQTPVNWILILTYTDAWVFWGSGVSGQDSQLLPQLLHQNPKKHGWNPKDLGEPLVWFFIFIYLFFYGRAETVD